MSLNKKGYQLKFLRNPPKGSMLVMAMYRCKIFAIIKHKYLFWNLFQFGYEHVVNKVLINYCLF